MPFTKPEAQPQFAKLEEKIAKFWKQNDIFKKSVANRKGEPGWRFYDGPPFISGTPHYGHIKDFVVKDAVPRYWTMKGYYAPRIWGWDCHGLPIENKVEKKLGIKSKLEVESMGVAKYIAECYDYTSTTSAEWPWYIEKMGRWIDYDHAYRTMDQDYMETVWWVFKTLWDKGLIYKGWRSSLYSTDSATPVSNFEIAMDNSYEDVEDDAVTVKFRVVKDAKYEEVFTKIKAEIGNRELSFLSWTTTPWTLPANFALAVHPEEDYVVVETSTDNAEISGRWLLKAEPFDQDKFPKAKIEEYLLAPSDGVEQAAIKIGKKFYRRNGQEQTEINQGEFQTLTKQAQGEPIIKLRVYYNLSADPETGKELSKEIFRKQPIACIDYYQGALEGLQLIEIQFNSPREYNSFKANLPDWFGQDLTGNDLLNPSNLSGKSFSELNTELTTASPSSINFDPDQHLQYLILASKLAEEVMKTDYRIIMICNGKELAGLNYEQLYPFFAGNENDFKVYAEEIVTVTDGTGVLHVAPAFGEEDFAIGKKHQLSFIQDIDDAGNLLPETGKFAGIYLRDAARPIINDLISQGKLYQQAKYTHRLPFYRYENPLIYRAQESWFINVQKLKDDLFTANENINWIPDHLKDGRFKKGIETAPDWSISRSRFWATSMPVWVVEDPDNPGKAKPNYDQTELVVIGSREELRQLSLEPITKVSFNYGSQIAAHELLAPEKLQAISERLQANNQGQRLCDLAESLLTTEFKRPIAEITVAFQTYLAAHRGEELAIELSAIQLAILRHIFEAKPLQESLASIEGIGTKQQYVMYFLDQELLNLHRNVIDKVQLKHPSTGQTLVRLPEVLDNWLDSGSMPFAQIHYPFENKQEFEASYPADYIVEYIAQTRAWFYVMHVLAVALTGSNSFKNAVTSGVLAGNDGRKMSKTYGNYPDPRATLEKYGAEAMRWYFVTSKLIMGEDINFDEKALRDQLRLYLLPLWNIYSFFVTYALVHNWQPRPELVSNKLKPGASGEIDTYWYKVPFTNRDSKLDSWIVAKLQQTIHETRTEMDSYFIPRAAKKIEEFVDLLSRQYVRRSRERFNQGEPEAFETLYYVLVEVIKLTAPFTPFIAEELYQNLVVTNLNDQAESVHLTDYPEADMQYLEQQSLLLAQFASINEIIDLGQSLRSQNGLKLRQPLADITIQLNTDSNQDKELKAWMKDLIAQELNIQEVNEGQAPEASGWLKATNENGNITVAINSNLTPELAAEGLLRELARQVQALRKRQGLKIGEQISLRIYTQTKEIVDLVNSQTNKLATATGAKEVYLDDRERSDTTPTAKINGQQVGLEIAVVA